MFIRALRNLRHNNSLQATALTGRRLSSNVSPQEQVVRISDFRIRGRLIHLLRGACLKAIRP